MCGLRESLYSLPDKTGPALFLMICMACPFNSWAGSSTYGALVVGVPGEGLESYPTYPTPIANAGAIHFLPGTASGLFAHDEEQFWIQDSPGILGDSEMNDYFGEVLATGDFNGDGKTDLAIGSPNEDVSSLSDAGAVNVLYGSGDKLSAEGNQIWTQASPDIQGASEARDHFGQALAVGDFNGDGKSDLAIGVPWEDVGTIVFAGAVNVIYGSAHGLSSKGNQLLLQSTASDGIEDFDTFGSSLAAGDFNGDGYCDLAVGVPGEDPGKPGQNGGDGAITVWNGSTGGLVPPPGGLRVMYRGEGGLGGLPSDGDGAFGFSLATGYFNSDNYADLAVGSPYADYLGRFHVGEVDIVYGSNIGLGGNWPYSGTLLRQNLISVTYVPEANDEFGSALAAGDINGDGRDDLAIGVPGEDIESASDAGTVHVLYGDQDTISVAWNDYLNQDMSLVQGYPEAGDQFGSALTMGDINGDGYFDIAIGVPGEAIDAVPSAGAVNVLYGSSSGITTTGNQLLGQHWPSIPDTEENFDRFGASLAIFPLSTPGGCFPYIRDDKVLMICW